MPQDKHKVLSKLVTFTVPAESPQFIPPGQTSSFGTDALARFTFPMTYTFPIQYYPL